MDLHPWRGRDTPPALLSGCSMQHVDWVPKDRIWILDTESVSQSKTFKWELPIWGVGESKVAIVPCFLLHRRHRDIISTAESQVWTLRHPRMPIPHGRENATRTGSRQRDGREAKRDASVPKRVNG